jgi:hypothetical protein
MFKVLLAVALLTGAVYGCSTAKTEEHRVDNDITQLQQQQDAISAAASKILVVYSSKVKGHPELTTLGPAQGFCFNLANSTGGQLVHGDSLRMAAYRKYGNQVDAVVSTSIWFVSDDTFAPYEPNTENGYFECSGTAVHFTSPGTTPSSDNPPH